MQRRNQSLLKNNTTKRKKKLNDIIQDYQQNKSNSYRLVVLGNHMELQGGQQKNWFQIYSRVQAGSSVFKNKQGLFSAYLSSVNNQKRDKKSPIKHKILQNRNKKSKFKENILKKKKNLIIEQNNSYLPIESNLQNENENESFNNFTLSFNQTMGQGVGKIKHQFINIPIPEDRFKNNNIQKQLGIQYERQEYQYQNPYAKDIIDEDSRESLKNIINCINQSSMKQQENIRELQKKEQCVEQIRQRINERVNQQRQRQQDTVQTTMSMNKKTQLVQNVIEFDISLDYINV